MAGFHLTFRPRLQALLRPAARLALAAALPALSGCTTLPGTVGGGPEGGRGHGYLLDSGWVCQNSGKVSLGGEELSLPSTPLSGWLPATVPGTVLTTLLNNRMIPDPLVGMNLRSIPDIFTAGREAYTYWFVRELPEEAPASGRQVWLSFRGVNYGFDVYLNGLKVNGATEQGMFLRRSYNITRLLSADGHNRLAVLVHPPDPVGNPNGGQGGDGTIARSVTNQFVAGWDWIQPVADRNTGIWDRVTIEKTGSVRLRDPNVVTLVPGKRYPGPAQAPALIRSAAEVENPTGEAVRGTLSFTLGGRTVSREFLVPARALAAFDLPELVLENPGLWWPNGYGDQTLYTARFRLTGGNGEVLDDQELAVGIREISTAWNEATRSREVRVNGQRIFMKGGNWVASDAMLRLSRDRYDAEVRFHRDMNLNLIRIWGGSITERPEFYDACDRYGLLVMQDLWISGDCNGKWLDRMKKEDQWTRRAYPDDHALFLRSVADQVKMLRHHPSLAFYCGGNEMPPPQDLLLAIQDSLLPALDGTRTFFPYSNADSMSFNAIGGNGDGPYGLQPPERFWTYRSFPFNSEIGSVGLGDEESIRRVIPPGNLAIPDEATRTVDSVWRFHKYTGYGKQIGLYGKPGSLRDFADRAQLVNFDQYRALMEGHLAHMWDWYTGVILWKTQNPWSALRGQMYDHFLDPNASLYGLRCANKPLHVMCSPADAMLYVVNNTFRPFHDLMLQARTIDIAGKDSLVFQWIVEAGPAAVQKIESLRRPPAVVFPPEGGFLDLRLVDTARRVLDENLYWIPDTAGAYSGLQRMPEAPVSTLARQVHDGRIEVRIGNRRGAPLAFFQRVSLVDRATSTRILPVFFSDNYVSVLPGETITLFLDYPPGLDLRHVEVSVRGWNVPEQIVDIQTSAAAGAGK